MRCPSSIPFLALLLLIGSVSGGGDGSCSSSNRYECPTEECEGTVYVSDCLDCDGYFSTDAKNKVCFDRKIFNAKANPSPAYLWYDVIGALVWFFAAGVATACGVGGGGIYVPLGILLLNFAPKPSSGLSQSSIFGASLGGLILNLRNRHPFVTKVDKSNRAGQGDALESVANNSNEIPEGDENTEYYARPLIDYDMALFLAPMEMAGAVLGVLIQKILPNWLYLTLAAIILGLTAKKTYGKYFDTHSKEKATREAAEIEVQQRPSEETLLPCDAGKHDVSAAQTANTSGSESSRRLSADADDAPEETQPVAESQEQPTEPDTTDEDRAARRKYWMEQDSRQYPADKLFALFVLWVGLVLLTFLKGGKGVESIIGITCASPWFGVLIAVQFAWTLGFSVVFALKLKKSTEEKIAIGYKFHPQDVIWDYSKTRFYAAFTFMAGIVAGLIGIGGGMVLGPLMLIMNVHPRVSSATTATMIVLTSSSVAVLFVTAGLVPWEYAVTFFSICFCGAYIGKTYIDGYVKRTGKASVLIFLLATIIALATLGCVVIVLTRLAGADWCFEGFHKFCNLHAEDEDEDRCEVNRLLFGEHDVFK
mmetsp:Transcript_95634/g.143269  ORF Transcript_95634/g.143269 Transcript_95634/m.143269 type:complete len:594 (+) Transcript_95634:205-1986(+)